MSVTFPIKLFSDIKKNTAYLAPVTQPKAIEVNIGTGDSVILPPFQANTMLVYVSGFLDPADEDMIALEFTIVRNGEAFPWCDKEGNAFLISLDGDKKKVLGPLAVPHHANSLQITETAAATSNDVTNDATYAGGDGPLELVKMLSDGSSCIAGSSKVKKFTNEQNLSWSKETHPDASIECLVVDNLDNMYVLGNDGKIVKLDAEGIVIWEDTPFPGYEVRDICWYENYLYAGLELAPDYYGVGKMHSSTRTVEWIDTSNSWNTPAVIANQYGVYSVHGSRIYVRDKDTGELSVTQYFTPGGYTKNLATNAAGNILFCGEGDIRDDEDYAVFSAGDGIETVFSGILDTSNYPQKGSVEIYQATDGVNYELIASDDGAGTITGDLLDSAGVNEIDYETRELTISFLTPPPVGTSFYVAYSFDVIRVGLLPPDLGEDNAYFITDIPIQGNGYMGNYCCFDDLGYMYATSYGYGTEKNYVYKLNHAGEVIWSHAFDDYIKGVDIRGSRVFVASHDTYIHILERMLTARVVIEQYA